jgi:uncharacterized protein
MSRIAKTNSCPICKKTMDPDFAPFCSRGCKDRDLLRWLGDGYTMPRPAVEYDDLPGDED